jgi:hypothetical protein
LPSLTDDRLKIGLSSAGAIERHSPVAIRDELLATCQHYLRALGQGTQRVAIRESDISHWHDLLTFR